MVWLIFGVIVFFIFLTKTHMEEKEKYEQKEKDLNEKIDFLWERYFLLRLYLEYNEQNSSKYPKDIIQATNKIDFNKLLYYKKKIENFYFTMKPWWYALSKDVINKLYEIDKNHYDLNNKYEELKENRLNEIISNNKNNKIDLIDIAQNDVQLDKLEHEQEKLFIDDIKKLREIQDKYENDISNQIEKEINKMPAREQLKLISKYK